MREEEIKLENVLVLSPDPWDMSYDLEASQKKLDEALTTYRAQVLEEKLHQLESKIDNVSHAPTKPSDYNAWQDGFMEAYQQARKVIHPTN
jgi:hypothetical protein